MSDLERIGKMILYRNRIIEKILRELHKEFPSMDILLEEFLRLLEAIDDLDNDVVATIARLKEKIKEKEKLEDKVEDRTEKVDLNSDFEEWFASVMNSFDGPDNMKNYIIQLKNLGGITIASRMIPLMGLKKPTLSWIETELESKGIIGSVIIADNRKIVYFNHPKFTRMSLKELERALKSSISVRELEPVSKERLDENVIKI